MALIVSGVMSGGSVPLPFEVSVMARTFNVFYRGNRWIGRRVSHWLPMGKVRYYVLTGTHRLVMDAMPFRGVFASEVRTKTWYSATPDNALVERRRRPSVKKVKLSERSSVKHLAPLESEYLRDVMPVVEALAMLQYEDGSVRQPGYLGVWTNGATWCVRLTDKDADAQLTAEGRTLDEALDTLGVHLGSDNAPWEPCSRRKKKGA